MAAQDLCTLQDVRSTSESPTADTARDALVQSFITAASDAIMQETGREFAPATTSAKRRFQVDGNEISLYPYDLRSVTLLQLHPEATSPLTLTAGSDYELHPVTPRDGVYTSVGFSGYLNLFGSDTAARMGHSLVDITGAWGFASVPNIVNRACVLTVQAWIRRDVSALGLSNEFDAAAGQPTPFGIPYEARILLSPFKRLPVF